MKTGKLILKIVAILIISISLFYAFLFCTKNEESGVKFGNIFTNHQNYISNLEFRKNIKKALNQDENGIIWLYEVPVDGESSYEMGYIITQIIYKIGEEKYLKMVKKLNIDQQRFALGYITVGLEYGDNDYDGEMDNTKFENEFPLLYQYYKNLSD
ncbi:hypothetical protein [Moheibacter lacus]|uniref:Uncharacterized protein n=1 Tax=Moheibacter lacus TaxID=2745851 RepID=A0A838ZKS2_9FLAO|nr:hypothetical protein [Moheibacter lacus]MBA5628280.1 hypothetical protein [Moheibacter lacus]